MLRAITIVAALLLGSACRTTQDPASQASDARIESVVKANLAKDVRLSTLTNIEVDVVRGEVTLSGLVANDDQKDRAEQVAENVRGVRKVRNNLQVANEGG
jgi:hyperosmotically inducible periplasmic protein